MFTLTLAEITAALDGAIVLNAGDSDDREIDGAVETDSRLLVPGGVFFALRGEETDGHLFAAAAVANGASLIVVERALDVRVSQIVVADGVAALAALAHRSVAGLRASGDLTVIGITGSNGKTTTKNLLNAVLSRAGETIAPRGSFNNHVGAPLSMLRAVSSTRFLVVEMGAAHAGEIAHLVGIARPDIAVVLKVGLAHAGGFGGIDATAKAKAEIVTGLPESGVAVLNGDDHRVDAMAGKTAARVVRFGLAPASDVRAVDLDTDASGTSFSVVIGEDSHPAHLRILGEHHVMNALAAIAVAVEVGVAPDAAIAAIGEVSRAERWRMEVLRPDSGITVINDAYNASPDSMVAALKTLAQITRGPGGTGAGRSIAVLGEMSELGDTADDEHDRIGRLVVRLNISQLVVVGGGARHIHNAAALEGSWDGESVLVDTADDAFDLLRDLLKPGDTVLVKSSNSAGLRFLGDRIGQVA